MNGTDAELLAKATTLLEKVVEGESFCWQDHHGGCQEHGYLSGTCLVSEIREFLRSTLRS